MEECFGRAVSRILSSPVTRRREPFIYATDTRNPAGLRRSATSRRSSSLFGLAPGEVFRARSLNASGGGLLPRLFTLTGLSPGGLFSVALSVRQVFTWPSRVYLHPLAPIQLRGPALYGVRTFLSEPASCDTGPPRSSALPKHVHPRVGNRRSTTMFRAKLSRVSDNILLMNGRFTRRRGEGNDDFWRRL